MHAHASTRPFRRPRGRRRRFSAAIMSLVFAAMPRWSRPLSVRKMHEHWRTEGPHTKEHQVLFQYVRARMSVRRSQWQTLGCVIFTGAGLSRSSTRHIARRRSRVHTFAVAERTVAVAMTTRNREPASYSISFVSPPRRHYFLTLVCRGLLSYCSSVSFCGDVSTDFSNFEARLSLAFSLLPLLYLSFPFSRPCFLDFRCNYPGERFKRPRPASANRFLACVFFLSRVCGPTPITPSRREYISVT